MLIDVLIRLYFTIIYLNIVIEIFSNIHMRFIHYILLYDFLFTNLLTSNIHFIDF